MKTGQTCIIKGTIVKHIFMCNAVYFTTKVHFAIIEKLSQITSINLIKYLRKLKGSQRNTKCNSYLLKLCVYVLIGNREYK